MDNITGGCPKCGKTYSKVIRHPTSAGEYDLFDGELKPPPCLSCARKEDKRRLLIFKEIEEIKGE